MKRLVRICLCMATLPIIAGCMDGPFHNLKKINPYYVSRWKKDRQYGPTYEDRLKELRSAESRMSKMNPVEQERWAERLETIIREDPSPELRATAARSVARIKSPVADRALNSASTDDVEKVRLIACDAWRVRGGTAARDMLLSMAQADESSSVRQAAVRSLAEFQEPEVISALGNLLDDDSPAMQYSVAQSLASLTGQKYGGDIEGWKRYLGIAPTGEPSPNAPEAYPPVMTASGSSNLPSMAP